MFAPISVQLIDHMGSDLSVANAARVSMAKESEWEVLCDGACFECDCNGQQTRQLVADTFAQVQIYFRGARPHTPANVLDVLLISKAGVARLLRLDRKTGELLHGLEKV